MLVEGNDDILVSTQSFAVGDYVFRLASSNAAFLEDACKLFEPTCDGSDAQVVDLDRPAAQFDPCDQISSLLSVITSAFRAHDGRLYLDGCVFRTSRLQSVLLAGASHSGKTTLSIALAMKLGWKLVSEDRVIIDSQKRCVVPMTGPLSLRADAPQLLAAAFDINLPQLYLNKWVVDHTLFCCDPVSHQFDFAVQLQRHGSDHMQVTNVTPAEFLRSILPISNALRMTGGVETLRSSVINSTCSIIQGGSLTERFGYLQQLTG